jgi:hypothetical protein
MTVDSFSMSVAPQAILTGGFSFLGADESSVSSTSGNGYDEAPTNDTMNAIDHITGVVENDTRLGITNFSMQLQNNLRARSQVATLGAISVGSGQINVTGTLQAYFTDSALFDRYLDFTTTRLILGMTDAQGNSYCIHLPSVKFTSGQRVAGGINTDIIADLQFSAKLDATTAKTIRIARFAV